MVPTEGALLADLQRYNPYFRQFTYSDTVADFVDTLTILQSLDAVDVAAYLHRTIKPRLTSFTLQKVLYFVYAEYLTKFGVPPFRANFVAFDNGPVEKDVYRLRKWQEHSLDDNYHFEEKVIGSPHEDLIPFITDVYAEYGEHFRDMNDEAQNLTHRPGTPWSEARQHGQNTPITETAIIERHRFEQI
ncbi:hypothetical protein L248_0693 [Schleiferilactobacillus shenzhenensis LY-73]|uniref:Antitoxin SocA-like Panacea domain-containing protein n=2 Tax=Schleiferilactobacillus shenzhenensis TaxID=1231337 RepID=U4TIJ5_9LACO|nr:hypothetical protein L248_0693 [Schleiferilactobacillus shenzhenensis LY-73]